MSKITISAIKKALDTLERSKTDEMIIGMQSSEEERIKALEGRFYHTRSILQDIIELMEADLTLDQMNEL